jgi:hypothetical protein
MNRKEKELINEDFLNRDDVYNLCPGGQGGFGFINSDIELITKRNQNISANRSYQEHGMKEFQRRIDYKSISEKSMETKRRNGTIVVPSTSGFKFSEESRKRMSEKASGSNGSQFGTMWITNGLENKKIKKDLEIIPEGWYKGRISK